ncbi:MAG: ATP-binding protein [Bacteroidetes bacterium]|nr:ATP-binding protein [Bacteroidota bacterium]
MLPRNALPQVYKALNRQAATALLGPRQVGKTTLALEIAKATKALYLDLQSNSDRARLVDPKLYLRHYEDQLVILDEIHRVPDLFSELRGLIDEGRRRGLRSGRFLLLGSATMDMLKQTGESLAGRIEFVSLNPLSILESDPDALDSLWVRGGFPDSFLANTDHDSLIFRQNFIRTYLERDLAEFVQVRIPAETLERLWTMLAHGQGGLLNLARLASNLAMSAPSVSQYIDILTRLLLIRRLTPYSTNTRKRLVKSPKIYIRDSGLLHALLGIEQFHDLAGHPIIGASWEGFVIENLLSDAYPRTRASFYRTSAGAELDLVVEIPEFQRPIAIEIKRSLTPSLSKGFQNAINDIEPERAFIVYGGEERYPVGESIEVIGLREMAQLLSRPNLLRS